MADARRAGREEEFFRINSNANPTGQLTDVANHCRQLPLCLYLLVQWLYECLNKADLKELRQHSQRLPSLCDTMVRFYQVNSRPRFSFFFFFYFHTLVFFILVAHGGHERVICFSARCS